MIATSLFCTDGNHLGRLNYESLTQQAQMEILMEGVTTRSEFYDGTGNFDDVCEWKGIRCTDDDQIQEIDWQEELIYLEGTVNLDYLPMTVTSVEITGYYNLSCRVDLTGLPPNLKKLEVENVIIGGMDVKKLPREMTTLRLFEGNCEGAFDTKALPPTMISLTVFHHHLSGSLDLRTLPREVQVFNVGQNELSGTLDLGKLPQRLHNLVLYGNKFHGTLNLTALPDYIAEVQIDYNEFSGEIHFGKIYQNLFIFTVCFNKFEGSLPLTEIQTSELHISNNNFSGVFQLADLAHIGHYVQISNNAFEGTMQFSDMPRNMHKLYANDNAFHGSIAMINCPNGLEKLKAGTNRLSGSLDLKGLTEKRLTDVVLSRNQFKGTLNFSALPRMLYSLDLSENAFSGTVSLSKVPDTLWDLRLSGNSLRLKKVPASLDAKRIMERSD